MILTTLRLLTRRYGRTIRQHWLQQIGISVTEQSVLRQRSSENNLLTSRQIFYTIWPTTTYPISTKTLNWPGTGSTRNCSDGSINTILRELLPSQTESR